MSTLYLITGPAGVGKSTISKVLAKLSKKSTLVEGDAIYNLISGGYISPWKEENHLDVMWENVIDVIDNFLSRDYDVIFNYIIYKKHIEILKNKFKEFDVKFVVLMTDEETIIQRDLQRPEDCRMGERSVILLNEFISENYPRKNILDTTNLSIEDTVDIILKEDRFNI